MRGRLKQKRINSGYTQENMASLTGIERTKYTRIENGSIKKITLDDAYLISRALNTTIEEIFLPIDVYEEHKKPTGTDG